MIGTDLLKRLRENYYLGNALAVVGRPVQVVCKRVSVEIQKKVKRNGVAIRLPNGQILRLARDAGIAISSLLFWNGLDGYEPQTSKTLRFFFERSAAFVDVGANYGYYSILGGLWNSALRIVSFEPVPEIYEALNRNISLNRLQLRVAAFNLALSDRWKSDILSASERQHGLRSHRYTRLEWVAEPETISIVRSRDRPV